MKDAEDALTYGDVISVYMPARSAVVLKILKIQRVLIDLKKPLLITLGLYWLS